MYLQLVNLYAFGETLRVLLWISTPLVIIFFLVTTWLNHRRQKEGEGLLYSVAGGEGLPEPGPANEPLRSHLAVEEIKPDTSGEPDASEVPGTREAFDTREALGTTTDTRVEKSENNSPVENENMYKGILWLKEKYEQYRDLADQRYERMREELNRSEKKYLDLVATLATPPATGETLASLKAQLQAEKQKSEDLVIKLQQNTELLMGIYKELDKSLYATSDRS